MWVFWPVVKLFNYLRVLMMQTKKSLDLFFGKLDDVIANFAMFSNLIFFHPIVR